MKFLVCSLPPEYCEYNQKSLAKCKSWLKDSHPELFEKLYGEGNELSEKLESTNISQQSSKSQKKKGSSAAAASRILIKRVDRNKKKHCTHIQNLESYGIDLKKAAKKFASRFACGSSVTENPSGVEEIVIQGYNHHLTTLLS